MNERNWIEKLNTGILKGEIQGNNLFSWNNTSLFQNNDSENHEIKYLDAQHIVEKQKR